MYSEAEKHKYSQTSLKQIKLSNPLVTMNTGKALSFISLSLSQILGESPRYTFSICTLGFCAHVTESRKTVWNIVGPSFEKFILMLDILYKV